MNSAVEQIFKKNIALFISTLHGGGAERVVSRLSKALSDSYNVFVFLIDARNQQYKCGENSTVVNLGGDSGNFRLREIKTIANINKAIRKYNIDTCISFLSGANMINSYFVKGCRKMVSVRCYIHKDTAKEYSHDGFDALEVRAYKGFCNKSDVAIAITRKMAESLVETYNLPVEKVKVIENLYDIDEIKDSISEGILPEDENIKDFMGRHKVTVSVGRLTLQKDYITQLEAFAKVVEKIPEAGLLILGEGDLKTEIEDKIEQLGLRNNVLLAGRKSNPFPYIAASELYISTSHVEGFPNGLVEAMACHVAPIHTNCLTGPEEILADGSGILLPNLVGLGEAERLEAIDEIARIWIDILNDDERRAALADKAFERAKDFSYEKIAEKWVEVIG